MEFKLSLCTQISPTWWLEFKSGVKVKFKWSFEVEFWNLSFHLDLVKTGIKKVEFKTILCTQISPGWWLEFKSGVKVEINWSFENEFWNPSFHPDLVKTGIQKVEFKSSFSPGFHPLGDWNSKVELKSSLSGV